MKIAKIKILILLAMVFVVIGNTVQAANNGINSLLLFSVNITCSDNTALAKEVVGFRGIYTNKILLKKAFGDRIIRNQLRSGGLGIMPKKIKKDISDVVDYMYKKPYRTEKEYKKYCVKRKLDAFVAGL